jgi:shikimate dehydrogenase
MPLYGLIGYPLSHSFSKDYFTTKFAEERASDCRYLNFEIDDIAKIEDVIRSNPTLAGFNVTIPYKKEIIPYLDAISKEATEIGAVNCVKIAGGRLTGHNTDAYGFALSLEELIGASRPRALVLGSGGAAEAVRYVLRTIGVEYITVSRTKKSGNITYEELTSEIIEERKLIINTTPLGMYPAVEAAPDIPYDGIGTGHFLFDLIYNPATTRFLGEGERRGAKTINGLAMLTAQADRSWQIWNE